MSVLPPDMRLLAKLRELWPDPSAFPDLAASTLPGPDGALVILRVLDRLRADRDAADRATERAREQLAEARERHRDAEDRCRALADGWFADDDEAGSSEDRTLYQRIAVAKIRQQGCGRYAVTVGDCEMGPFESRQIAERMVGTLLELREDVRDVPF